MIKKISPRVLYAFILAFLTSVTFIPAPLARADEAVKAPASTGKCMMWKVSSKTATVYLVGSIHLAMPQMYPLPKEMEEAFKSADTLVVEVNINKIDQQKMFALVTSKGMYAGDETLSGNLKKETWTDLKAVCETLGLPPAGIEKMKPWLIGVTIQVMEIQKLGLDPNLGIDKHFLDIAEKDGKKIEELESADFQIGVLAGFDAKTQEESLVLGLAEIKDMKADLADLTDAWTAGDVAALDKHLTKAEREHPETKPVSQKMIYDRNGPMAAKVEEYLKGDKTVFVIAGCAHMVGDKGVVKLLQDDKFTVEQSPATPAKAEK